MDLMAQLARREEGGAGHHRPRAWRTSRPRNSSSSRSITSRPNRSTSASPCSRRRPPVSTGMGMESKGHDRIDAKTLGDFYMQVAAGQGSERRSGPRTAPVRHRGVQGQLGRAHRRAPVAPPIPGYQPFVTEIDRNGVWPYERRSSSPTCSTRGTLSGNTIEYPGVRRRWRATPAWSPRAVRSRRFTCPNPPGCRTR